MAAIRALARPYLFSAYEKTILEANGEEGDVVRVSASAVLDCLVVAKRMNASSILPDVPSTWLASFAANRGTSMDGIQMTRYCVSASRREEEAADGRSGWGFAVENADGKLVRLSAEFVAACLLASVGKVFPEPVLAGVSWKELLEGLYAGKAAFPDVRVIDARNEREEAKEEGGVR